MMFTDRGGVYKKSSTAGTGNDVISENPPNFTTKASTGNVGVAMSPIKDKQNENNVAGKK